MFSHTTLGTDNLDRSLRFYDAVMKSLRHDRFFRDATAVGYGDPDGDQFWLVVPVDGKRATVGNGTTIGLLAPDRAIVRSAHGAALKKGGSDEGAPGLRDYHKNFYGAYVRDPDGNKLCVVCHNPEEGDA